MFKVINAFNLNVKVYLGHISPTDYGTTEKLRVAVNKI
jgi:hypothetical protein